MILAQREQLTLAKSEVTVGRLEIERLKLMLAKARREQFGQSSERGKLLVEQLELAIEDLEETQAELCSAFARSGGDKFTGVDWWPGPSGAPLLTGAAAWIECRLEIAHEAGDHEVAIGRVLSLARGSGRPLVFCDSEFVQLKLPADTVSP